MSSPPSRWCHVTITTYGNWLPGDPRGFRTWDHREHVEGDYKSPPKEDYSERLAANKRRQRSRPTVLTVEQREIVCLAIRERLAMLDVLVVCVAMGRCHGHVLAKFPLGDAREPIGVAKRHAWYCLREIGWSGRLWAKRCGVKSIHDRKHQLNVYRYILEHEREGAFVWAWHRDHK
jgi:hypothetical protein